MNIKFIFPTEESDLKAFQERIDTLHCDMIFATLNALEIPYSEKLQILKDTMNIISNTPENTNWMTEYQTIV